MGEISIAAFRAVYAQADAFCQEVQGFLNQAGIPAVNELRNAGHHFLQSVGDDGTIVGPEDLQSAISHARRACYEASEAGILTAIEIIKKFRLDYSAVEVGSAVPNYVASIRTANTAMEQVERARTHGDNRAADHETRIAAFRELRGFCNDLDAGREEMNKKNALATQLQRRFLVGIAIAALALAWAIARYFIGGQP